MLGNKFKCFVFNNLTDIYQFGYLGCLNITVRFAPSIVKIYPKFASQINFYFQVKSFLTNLTVNVKFWLNSISTFVTHRIFIKNLYLCIRFSRNNVHFVHLVQYDAHKTFHVLALTNSGFVSQNTSRLRTLKWTSYLLWLLIQSFKTSKSLKVLITI